MELGRNACSSRDADDGLRDGLDEPSVANKVVTRDISDSLHKRVRTSLRR